MTKLQFVLLSLLRVSSTLKPRGLTSLSTSFKTMAKSKTNILTSEELTEFKDDDFPFENIAFEGGGSKGTAHIGAVRVSESNYN